MRNFESTAITTAFKPNQRQTFETKSGNHGKPCPLSPQSPEKKTLYCSWSIYCNNWSQRPVEDHHLSRSTWPRGKSRMLAILGYLPTMSFERFLCIEPEQYELPCTVAVPIHMRQPCAEAGTLVGARPGSLNRSKNFTRCNSLTTDIERTLSYNSILQRPEGTVFVQVIKATELPTSNQIISTIILLFYSLIA